MGIFVSKRKQVGPIIDTNAIHKFKTIAYQRIEIFRHWRTRSKCKIEKADVPKLNPSSKTRKLPWRKAHIDPRSCSTTLTKETHDNKSLNVRDLPI